MWIVAIRTYYFASIDRVGGNLVAVGALFLMAGEADLSLSLLFAYLIDRGVDLVATVAGDLIVLMLTAIPVGAGGTLMASQALTGACLVIGQGIGALFEDDIWSCASLDGRITLQMLFTLAVARLTVWCA